MISKEEMEKMTASEMAAYMRGYRDGQVDMRDLVNTNFIPWITTTTPTWTCSNSTAVDPTFKGEL